jgi:DNA-binding XRE family transcriptional regulator
MFPSWFTGVAFAAIAVGALVPAAIMSIAAANHFSRNIWREHVHPAMSRREEAPVSKVVSLLVKVGARVRPDPCRPPTSSTTRPRVGTDDQRAAGPGGVGVASPVRSRLRHLREREGLTQADLAELVCVKPPTVSLWENGHNAPTPDTRQRLAELFSVTADELDLGTPKPAGGQPAKIREHEAASAGGGMGARHHQTDAVRAS